MSFTKGKFTIDEIGFIHTSTIKVLVAASNGEIDLNLIAREELAHRGMDNKGVWVGFEQAKQMLMAQR